MKIVNHYLDIVAHYRQHVFTQQNLRTGVETCFYSQSAQKTVA